jgi:predicted DNA binding CopG/RHH family protein
MPKEKKKFKSFPTRNIRLSDKAWIKLKSNKVKSGLSWNLYIVKLLEKQCGDKV